ncbi:hypothetical protein BV22DRAFT_1102063 [Leucogyrophana mollusca]|uniref:Uncharacterized protein n=1 Tax=Leucogyrophana mollusca TaxID=85980 RepID=A0ACB8BX96_9AGAM|nr:hypothetical protein BV22DRAFT_1102063 [Leucogyrophana mollusca]
MDSIVNPEVYTERRVALFRRIQEALDDLPVLNADSIPKDESCAICLTPFSAVLVEQTPPAELDSSEGGITKVAACGHMFCRKDLSEWIRNFHGSCPTCRHPFLDIQPITDSDAESSDGDYIPEEDDEDEDDEFLGPDFFDEVIEIQDDEMDLDFDFYDTFEYSGSDVEDEWRDLNTAPTVELGEGEDVLPYEDDYHPVDDTGSTPHEDASPDAK